MFKFEERITQKITIPDKSISTGFKIFALGDSDYIYNWECTRSGLVKELKKEKKRISVCIPNSDISVYLNSIQSVVIRLVKCLDISIQKELSFQLFLDNLFVC